MVLILGLIQVELGDPYKGDKALPAPVFSIHKV